MALSHICPIPLRRGGSGFLQKTIQFMEIPSQVQSQLQTGIDLSRGDPPGRPYEKPTNIRLGATRRVAPTDGTPLSPVPYMTAREGGRR